VVLKDIPRRPPPREAARQRRCCAGRCRLIALLLRTGLKGVSVLQLAQQLLDRFGGIQGLLHAQANDLKSIKAWGRPSAPRSPR